MNKLHTCPTCKQPEKRYEVKVKNIVKEYYIGWPCYDARDEKSK